MSATKGPAQRAGHMQLSVPTDLRKSVELRTNGLQPIRDSNRVMEDCIVGVDAVCFLKTAV